MRTRCIGLLLLALAAGPARAVDPGTVKGTFLVQKQPIELKYACALLLDNAEGLLDRPRELRILLADREVAPELLQGVAFPPITDLARQGKVRGLLLELDPGKPTSAQGVLLMPPAEPGQSLTSTSYSAEPKLFKRWEFTPERVVGALDRLSEPDPNLPNLTAASFSVEFDVPITKEPAVTADLKGPGARTSAPAQAILACANLLAAGDLAGARKLQTERQNRNLDAAKLPPAQMAKLAKEGGAEMKRSVNRIQRVVVRGNRAVVIVGKGEWYTLVQEEGRWKLDF